MTDLTVIGFLLLAVICALFLIALEVFIPGVSLAGVLALILIFISTAWCWSEFGALAGILLLLITTGAAFLIVRAINRSMKYGKLSRSGMFLDTESAPTVHSAQTDALPAAGSIGRTATMLRPSGIAEFDGKRIHVTTQGDFIEANTEIIVIQAEGTRIIVATKQ